MMEKQKQYCEKNNLPFFAPETGRCFACRKMIDDNGEQLITGCQYCNYSYCE